MVDESDKDIIPEIVAGMRVDRGTSKPPWLVIDHNLDDMILTRWPLTLWKAKVIKPISPQGHIGNYTRCISIEVLEQLPTYLAFSDTDRGITDILDVAQNLSAEDATLLASSRNENADLIYSNAWKKWLEINNIEGRREYSDWSKAIEFGIIKGGAPVRHCFSLIEREVFERAGELVGDDAYLHEEDGTPYLAPPWNQAASTLIDAAMACGASYLVDQDGYNILMSPLRTVTPDQAANIEAKALASNTKQ